MFVCLSFSKSWYIYLAINKKKCASVRRLRIATFKLKILLAGLKSRQVLMGGEEGVKRRATADGARVLGIYAKQIRRSARAKAGLILQECLIQRQESASLRRHLCVYVDTINLIISRWREFQEKKGNFQRMLGYLFDKYFTSVLETSSKSDHPLFDDFFSQISKAKRLDKVKTDQARNRFIECYLQRRRNEYASDLQKYFSFIHRQNEARFGHMKLLFRKRQEEQGLDFKTNKFEVVSEDREQQLNSLLFNQQAPAVQNESLNPPRFFIVPSFEVLKQVIFETVAQAKDENIVKRLKEEKIRKNWSESTFLKHLMGHDDVSVEEKVIQKSK